MATELRWTSAALEVLPDDGKRYEIIDGELSMSKPLHYHNQASGLVVGEGDDVVPDAVWIGQARFATAPDEAAHLRVAPEPAVEVLSPGKANEDRDRTAKLKLYSRQRVQEYSIVDWRQRQIQVYRRERAALDLVATLYEQDQLRSPLLPGFMRPVTALFDTVNR